MPTALARRTTLRRTVAATAVTLLATSGLTAVTSPAQAHSATDMPQVTALYAKHVKSTVQDVTVFKSPTGSDNWGSWGPCTNFWTDRTDGSRYHTWLSNGADAWVTSNSAYIASGHC